MVLSAIQIPAHALDQPCKIVTSFSILQDLVSNIVGSRCTVQTIVGPNEDAHVFEPKPGTHTLIKGADVIVINGLGFESWMERLLKATDYHGPVIIAANQVKPIYVYLPDNAEPVPDPHAWHTIGNGIHYINEITADLVNIFPQFAKQFHHNAQTYISQLKLLDKKFHTQIAILPSTKRRVITAHDAFGYLSNYYGIIFMSPLGISTDADPSAKHIAFLIEQIKKTKIKAIFIENIANNKLINQLLDETGLTVSGELYSDALSHKNEPASTYIKMMDHNMSALIKAMAENEI